MKKLITIILLIVVFAFILGCNSTGKAYTLKPGELFAAERTVSATNVEINLLQGTLQDDEIVILAEKTPTGVTFVDNSWSIEPTIKGTDVALWIFAKNPPQTLGSKTISTIIPANITYQVSSNVQTSDLKGKWGLYKANIEGIVLGSTDGPPGEVTIMDVLNAIEEYSNGTKDIMYVLDIIDKYSA